MSEAVFSRPMIALAGERIADAGRGPGAILGMKLFLPEADFVGGSGRDVAQEGVEALRPGERAGGYSPNPNSIIRSLGSERKMLRDFIRAARRVRRIFMGSVGSFYRYSVMVLLGYLVSLNFRR